ncbi:MAG: hypothetical protein Q8L35_04310, partial [Actinomycetota bacterium]|nr:hypothetical protein [Actinomycetota bacterium]
RRVKPWADASTSKAGLVEDISRLGEKSSTQLGKVDKQIIDREIEGLARLGEKSSVQISKIDIMVIDALIDRLATLGEHLSNFTGRFDLNVVDGIVNGVGTITQKAGKRLRPFQTGDVQTYGLVMMMGALFALVFLVLVFYGIISLT